MKSYIILYYNLYKKSIEIGIKKTIRILLIILLMYFAIKIGKKIINMFVDRQKKSRIGFNYKKTKTIGEVLKSILKYTVYFLGILGILTELFGTLSLTFAGIGGIAIGFGAQSIIKDVLNGFIILFEDQYNVGDYIDVEGKSGIVESIGLRSTRIRDFNGDLHILPNGTITNITNHSKGDLKITVDLNIDYEKDIGKSIKIIDDVCAVVKKENENECEMSMWPAYTGITKVKGKYYTLRIEGKTAFKNKYKIETILIKQLKEAFDIENIKLY